ncbi:hypothetical protein X975_17806, partial [Stegodyphus mimosarum]
MTNNNVQIFFKESFICQNAMFSAVSPGLLIRNL